MKTHSSKHPLRATVGAGTSALLVAAALLLGSGFIPARAGYSITWSKIACGGGTSQSGQYKLSSTLGQYDAGGPMRGGNFALTGGFWSFAAVQTPGAPRLRIFMSAHGAIVVAWPASATGWTLEHCSNLSAPAWSAASGAVNVVGNENQFMIASPSANQFFRLAYPTAENVAK